WETTEPYYPARDHGPTDFGQYLMPGPGDLAPHHISILERPAADGPFGGKGELKGAERFTLGSWSRLATGAPVLEGASGVIDCEVEEAIERHGTLIVLGRVRDFAATDGKAPMVSYKGKTL
ncbi:MAG: flavin reductase family protein, partial [Devosia sp.]